MKKLILIIPILFLISLLAASAEIQVTQTQLTEDVIPGSKVDYELILSNPSLTADHLVLSPDSLSLAPFSDSVDYIVITPSQITLNQGEIKKAIVSLYILKDTIPNRRYASYVWIRSLLTENERKEEFSTHVREPAELVKIVPYIDEIIPGKTTNININLKNTINSEVTFDLVLNSTLISEVIPVTLEPLEEKTQAVPLNTASSALPGNYPLAIYAMQKTQSRGQSSLTLSVKTLTNVAEKTETQKAFLIKTQKIEKTNTGNVKLDEILTLPISRFQRIFAKTDPVEAESCIARGCQVTLEPGETSTITIRTNYIALLIIIIAVIIIALLIYRWSVAGVILTKSVFKLKQEKELSDMKIMLHIRNNTRKTINHAKIMDVIPNLAKLHKEFGTVHPTKIQKGASGFRLVWELEEMEPGEERVFAYKIQTKLPIVGGLNLPNARVHYKLKKKVLKTVSNPLILKSNR